jgi:hypothetical protein
MEQANKERPSVISHRHDVVDFLNKVQNMPVEPPFLFLDTDPQLPILKVFVLPLDRTWAFQLFPLQSGGDDWPLSTENAQGSSLKKILESKQIPKVFIGYQKVCLDVLNQKRILTQGVIDMSLLLAAAKKSRSAFLGDNHMWMRRFVRESFGPRKPNLSSLRDGPCNRKNPRPPLELLSGVYFDHSNDLVSNTKGVDCWRYILRKATSYKINVVVGKFRSFSDAKVVTDEERKLAWKELTSRSPQWADSFDLWHGEYLSWLRTNDDKWGAYVGDCLALQLMSTDDYSNWQWVEECRRYWSPLTELLNKIQDMPTETPYLFIHADADALYFHIPQIDYFHRECIQQTASAYKSCL